MTPEQLAYFSGYNLIDEHPFSRPWSRGDFSFATNGHVMVRVRKVGGISERDDAPDTDKVMHKLDFATCTRAMPLLPPLRFFTDWGSGDPGLLALWRETVTFQSAIFDLRYLHLISSLPGLRCGTTASRTAPMPFTFAGGAGALMPCETAPDLHHDLDISAEGETA